MKTLSFSVICGAFVLGLSGLVVNVVAQERSAQGGVNAQMTWGALSSNMNVVGQRLEEVNNRVDQVVVCGKKNMIYAPDAAGADANDCVYAGLAPSTTTIINNMSVCARTGAVYSDTTKACVQPDKPRWYHVGGVVNLSGIPVCAGGKGNVARLCASQGERCYKTGTTTTVVEERCKQTGDTGGHEGCTGGGTFTSTYHNLYACE